MTIEDSITKFFEMVTAVDRNLNFVTTKEGDVFDFKMSRDVGGFEWVIVNLTDSYLPFCIGMWEKEHACAS